MSQTTDSELIISTWSPAWIDGSGVEQVSRFLIQGDPEWRPVETRAIPSAMLDARLQSVRNCGHAAVQTDGSLSHSEFITVSAELTRLDRGRRGPRRSVIVEHAASAIPCRLGLHSVDVRFAVPEATLQSRPGRKPSDIAQGVLSTFRGVCESFESAWALCLTFGRGPSIAELYKRHESVAMFAAAHLPSGTSSSTLADLEKLAPVHRTAAGYEFIFSPVLGGSGLSDEASAYGLLRSAMRQISVPMVPRELLSEMDAQFNATTSRDTAYPKGRG